MVVFAVEFDFVDSDWDAVAAVALVMSFDEHVGPYSYCSPFVVGPTPRQMSIYFLQLYCRVAAAAEAPTRLRSLVDHLCISAYYRSRFVSHLSQQRLHSKVGKCRKHFFFFWF